MRRAHIHSRTAMIHLDTENVNYPPPPHTHTHTPLRQPNELPFVHLKIARLPFIRRFLKKYCWMLEQNLCTTYVSRDY